MSSVLNSQPVSPSKKNTKRKIDDALHNLDQALRTDDGPKQPPAKKVRFPSTLYSTLAKYGIKTSKSSTTSDPKSNDLNFLQKTAPHLSAILSRAATKKQKMEAKEEISRATLANVSTASTEPKPVDFRPSSTTSFLARLATYKLSTYSSKPSQVDAVAASKAGWTNEGKERLVCSLCKASWVLAPRDGMSREAANTLIEKQRNYLVTNHKNGCPWKVQQCDDSIYCLPLKAPSVLSKEIKKSALELDSKKALEGVEIRHPLASTQVQALLSALSSVQSEENDSNASSETVSESNNTSPGMESPTRLQQSVQEQLPQKAPTQTAALTALFGWSIVPPSEVSSESTNISATRVGSVTSGPSRRMSWNTVPTSISVSPITSSTTNNELSGPSYNGLGVLGSPRPSRIPVPRTASTISSRLPRREFTKEKDNTILSCALCQRRIGLWTFKSSNDTTSTTNALSAVDATSNNPGITVTTSANGISNTESINNINASGSRLPVRRAPGAPLPKRQFDLLKEHRSYCPFVVRTTVVPSLSTFMSSIGNPPDSPTSPVSPTQEPSTPKRPSLSRRASSGSTFSFTFSSPRNAPAYPGSPTSGAGGMGDPAAVEGWRAVLTVVLRTGLGKRHRQRAMMNVKNSVAKGAVHSTDVGANSTAAVPSEASTQESSGDSMEVDGVQAMVADVKSRGGRDLLRYVRGLFN